MLVPCKEARLLDPPLPILHNAFLDGWCGRNFSYA